MPSFVIVNDEQPQKLHILDDMRTENGTYWALCRKGAVVVPPGNAYRDLERCEVCYPQ
jgi:hypothetical protein